jgi:signal transduction histidine kinase
VVSVPLTEIRARVLKSAVAQAMAEGGLLFEPQPGGMKTAGLTCATDPRHSRDWEAGLSTDLLLARWLRVNGTVLPLPESSGLWASLPSCSREWLARRSVHGCIPLVHEMKLAGWVFVLGGQPWSADDPRRQDVATCMPAWAGALGSAQMEHEAAARAALVSRANRLTMAGHLAASSSHEARNSLSAVRSMVQLVLSKEVPAVEQDRLLRSVLAEIDRVNAAVSRTLELGRTREATWASVDVTQWITDAANFCRAYARRRGQIITVRRVTSASVRGDQNELRQVLVNVLLNACQASADGASIEVEDTVAAGRVSITVRDRGAGMTPELMARAFEPFYSTKQDGGGLGLAISRDIVQQHGGDITLESEVGAGTTATIRLPLGESHGPHPRS